MDGNLIGLSRKFQISHLKAKNSGKSRNTHVYFLTDPKWRPRVLNLIFLLTSNMGKQTDKKIRAISIV